MLPAQPQHNTGGEANGLSDATTGEPRSVSGRVVALSMLLIGVMCWWIAYSEIKTSTTEITCTALPIGVIFVVFVVACVNALVAKKLPRFALSPGEMATLYILVAVGSSLAGIGMIGFLTPAIANPVWFTNDKWGRFADSVPAWWSPRDAGAVRDFYFGNSTLYTWPHVRAWFFPIVTWGSFLFLLLLMTLCFAVILRRQWVEHERLSFPITILPIAMTAQPGGIVSLLRNRMFLFGFLLPVILQSVNNLHWLFPNLPEIPLKPTANGPLDIGALLKTPPWNALGYFPLAFHPNTIGLSYLLATDVSFSCWFFYLARKLLDVACVTYGYRDPGASSASSRMPYMQEQGVGAWLCLAALSLWMARRHLAAVARGALHPDKADDAREAMSYRLALVGCGFCFICATAFAWWGGLPLGASVLLFVLFAAYMLALTRIRAEAGTAWHFGPFVTAPEMVTRIFGPMSLNVSAISVLAYHTWYNIDYRSVTTPHLFEAYKVAEAGKLHLRRLTAAMVLAMLVGITCASWTVLHLYYIYGASTAHVNPWRINMGKIPYQVANSHLSGNRVGTDTSGLTALGVGALVTLLLHFARISLPNWPFHPAGYAIANTFIPDLLWFPFFLGWLAKCLILRYGGMKAYRNFLPFFIGLILGDYVIASLWTFVGMFLNIEMYRCFPN